MVQADIGPDERRARAQAGVRALQRWYVRWTGQWRTTGWWNAANALTALVRYMQVTGDQQYRPVIERTFRGAGRTNQGFINKFYDDNGWWALAWLDAYDLTGAPQYADAARSIFVQMLTGWDEVCQGGVWWNTDRKYKNAITNELFLSLAARLHQAGDPDGRYLDWAMRSWDWFRASGMTGQSGLVNDGLTDDCRNNGKPTYTYNQGVLLGGLAALYDITGERAHLDSGDQTAGAAITMLVSPQLSDAPGILVEPGEEDMATEQRRGDASQFKGIFVRNLCDFARRSARPAYRDFILANADWMWDHDRDRRDQFGLRWTGPFDVADASRQSSALDLLVAAAALA